MIRHSLHLAVAVLSLAGLTHCSEAPPTNNPVRSIDPAAFDGITSDGAFKGLVVVMASWCPPCRKELPVLTRLHEKYKGSSTQIVALSIDAEGPKAVQALINKLGVSFPVYWAGTAAVQHYRISGVPLLMVYDRGKLIQRLPGSHSAKTIEKIIKALQTSTG
jgi:thiol-disulfide isomerase/thioredoxin